MAAFVTAYGPLPYIVPVTPAPDVVARTWPCSTGRDHSRHERLDAVDDAEQVDARVQLPRVRIGVEQAVARLSRSARRG